MPQDDFAFMSAVELAATIRERKISPVDVTKATLARIEKLAGRRFTVSREPARPGDQRSDARLASTSAAVGRSRASRWSIASINPSSGEGMAGFSRDGESGRRVPIAFSIPSAESASKGCRPVASS